MSIYGIIFFTITSLSFLFWYGGKSKPLSKDELEQYINSLKASRKVDDASEIINDLKELCTEDDGKSFYMVNLMKFKTVYNDELGMTPLEAHKRYGKGITKELFKRAGHPIFLSKVTGSFLKDSDSTWDEVGIIRYRSKRDMLKMILNLSDPELGKYKWAALEKTNVFPTKLSVNLAFIRIIVITLLFLISTLF